MTTKLDRFLAYSESRRGTVCAIAGILTAGIAWLDSQLPDAAVDFLYLLPILVAASVLSAWQILLMALCCGILREIFDPMKFGPGLAERLAVVVAGFAMTGLFFAELNQRRRNLVEHLAERERQIRLRQEAEQQVRILIETSPLAILTLDYAGRVALANESARELFGFEDQSLPGTDVAPYLPILHRMLKNPHSAANLRTNVECKEIGRASCRERV